MSRIVFAWELGTGYGYVSQFLPFARELKKNGHEVLLVLRELHHLYRIIDNRGIPVLQAPLWLPTVQGLPEPPLNFAEMMLRFGYHDAQGLAGVVSAWRALLMLYQADLLVASHAPTALLAARSMGIKAATLGTGFHLPHGSPTPNMRPWVYVPPERLESSDGIVLKTINTILQSCAKPPMTSLADWFDVEENFLCTFPEIDHFSPRKDVQYRGVAYDGEMGRNVPWPIGKGKKVLVYLSANHRDLVPLVNALKSLKLHALVFALGVPDNQRKELASDNIVISADPIHLDGALEQCDLAICHAGHGTTARMLLAGVPVVLFASHLEQYLLARRVAEMGAGQVVNLEEPAPDFVALINDMLVQPEYKEKALVFAQRHANFSHAVQVNEISQRIAEIAQS